MKFFKRRRSERDTTRGEASAAEEAISERDEQKKRSLSADKDYYKAMRRFALEAHDAASYRRYDQMLSDLEALESELEVLSGERRSQ